MAMLHWRCSNAGLLQYMAGGDLCSTIQRDVRRSARGGTRLLSWYRRGRIVIIGVARGLAHLHKQGVRAGLLRPWYYTH